MINRPCLKAYLLEDEPLCRADFRTILLGFPSVILIGEAESLAQARKDLRLKKADVLFLDLSVGKESGYDLLHGLEPRPYVIALTAYPEHAARGFALDLVDYILKPVDPDRLSVALEKVFFRKELEVSHRNHPQFLADFGNEKQWVGPKEILRVESMGNYVLLHTPRGNGTLRITFQKMAEALPENAFIRAGRGKLVARSAIQGWFRAEDGTMILRLVRGGTVEVSRKENLRVRKLLLGSGLTISRADGQS